MLARECSLEDCSMQQDPQPKMPLIELCPGSRYLKMSECSRLQMRPATDFINWYYKVTYVSRTSAVPDCIHSL